MNTTTVAVRFNTDDQSKIEPLLNFVKSLDLVSSVEVASEASDPSTEAPGFAPGGRFLPVEEIQRLYPDEWVLLAEAKWEGVKILGGTVLLHESSKRDMALKGRDLIKMHKRTAHLYTGTFPKRPTIGLMRQISKP